MIDNVVIVRGDKSWTRICRSIDVVEGRGVRVDLDIEFDLAVFRIGGAVRCTTNSCPHLRIPVICDGHVEDGVVTCPMHGWRFQVETGENLDGGGRLRTYEAIEEDGFVYVTLR